MLIRKKTMKRMLPKFNSTNWTVQYARLHISQNLKALLVLLVVNFCCIMRPFMTNDLSANLSKLH